MLGTYFYHGNIRKVTVAVGALFNDIHVQKLDVDGNEFEILKGMNLCLNYADEIYIEMIQDKKNHLNYSKIINFLKKNFYDL